MIFFCIEVHVFKQFSISHLLFFIQKCIHIQLSVCFSSSCVENNGTGLICFCFWNFSNRLRVCAWREKVRVSEKEKEEGWNFFYHGKDIDGSLWTCFMSLYLLFWIRSLDTFGSRFSLTGKHIFRKASIAMSLAKKSKNLHTNVNILKQTIKSITKRKTV